MIINSPIKAMAPYFCRMKCALRCLGDGLAPWWVIGCLYHTSVDCCGDVFHDSNALQKARSGENIFQNKTERLLRKLSNPDIPKADWLTVIAVCLQFDWRGVILFVKRLPNVQRFAL